MSLLPAHRLIRHAQVIPATGSKDPSANWRMVEEKFGSHCQPRRADEYRRHGVHAFIGVLAGVNQMLPGTSANDRIKEVFAEYQVLAGIEHPS